MSTTPADSDSLINNTNQFITLETVKSDRNIEDDLSDNVLLPLIAKCNQHMTHLLLPVIDRIDLTSTEFFSQARNVIMSYFDYLYEKKISKLYSEAEGTLTEFEVESKAFIKAIREQPLKSTRSQVASVSATYETRLTKNIPGMTDANGDIIDEFGDGRSYPYRY